MDFGTLRLHIPYKTIKILIMKTFILSLLGWFATLAVAAQTNTVTVTVNGNRNTAVIVDGRTYSVNDYSTTQGNKRTVTITDLLPGQHTIALARLNNSSASQSSFYLRSGYNMNINIRNNGGIRLSETRMSTTAYGRNPMTENDFDVLLTNIQRQRRAASRTTAVTDAINNGSYYFSTAQALQLLEFVNSESNRLRLAETVYPRITDPVNFTNINEVLYSQSSRNQLSAYVSNYSRSNSNYTGYPAYSEAMTDASFNTIYRNIKNRWLPGDKMSGLTDAFANSSYYFTSAQAKQLIQLVSSESNRLQLAKSAYAHITDPGNFTSLYDLFSQSARNDLANYIATYSNNNYDNNYNNGNYNNGNVYNQYRTPVTDANFNSIYSDVQSRWGLGTKMSALRDVFANTNYYFTASQARQLIQLVNDEDNRLELAKSAYRNLTDQYNYTMLFDLFGSQSRRDDLANYVRSYSN
jgi:hypothetical protein